MISHRKREVADTLHEDQEETAGAPVHPPGLGEWAKAEKPVQKPRSKGAGITAAAFNRAQAEAERRAGEGDWEGASALVFVAAYARLHELVYGLLPAELGPQERKMALFAASRMLKREFSGEGPAMAAFVQWAWQREQAREKRRQENGQQGFRMTWRLLFGGAILTDYRWSQMRAKGQR